jgi:hypothetical protein
LTKTTSQLDRIEEKLDRILTVEQKLDKIIHALGLDGRKSTLDIKQDVKNIVVELRERQLTKKRKKDTKESCL